jgi:hypothetical protein
VRVVQVGEMVRGEFAENEIRKNFAVSERVAIIETMERMKQGQRTDLQPLPDLANVVKAAELAGFSSRQSADNARRVVRKGIPELVAAMDREEIAIDAAALIAKQPPEKQREIAALSGTPLDHAVKTLRYRERRGKSARRAARVRRWAHLRRRFEAVEAAGSADLGDCPSSGKREIGRMVRKPQF